MKKVCSVMLLLAVMFAISIPAFAVEDSSYPVSPCLVMRETPVWETISTNDIVYPEEESLGDIPLDQLVSACLSGDESWAEACDDELYHRFVEAPFTVCSYISLIQDDEKIERVCDGISVAEVCWGLDQEIEDIISNMREFSLSSAEAHTVSILENSYQRIVELNK